MLSFLSGLATFLSRFADWLRNKQQQDAGRAIERSAAQAEVIHDVKAAQDAVVVPDAARDERLRRRFDRSSGDSQCLLSDRQADRV